MVCSTTWAIRRFRQPVSAVVGELDTTDNDYIGRLVAKFTLPDLAEYPPLERAAPRYSVSRVDAPAGPLSILHSATDNDLNSVATDFEDTSYVDTQEDLLSPNDLPGNYFEVDVTEQILTDLANEGAAPVSAFRFQVSEANFVEDNTSHDYRLRVGNNASSTPMLVLSFVLNRRPGVWDSWLWWQHRHSYGAGAADLSLRLVSTTMMPITRPIRNTGGRGVIIETDDPVQRRRDRTSPAVSEY